MHVKDFGKKSSSDTPWGWSIEARTIGKGDVDIPACLRAVRDAGYDGFAALEYEGPEDEKAGVPESLQYLREVMQKL